MAGEKERWRLPGSSGAAAMGMAQGPGEELAPRGRTGYSDAELVRAEGRLLTALSERQRRHGRPPGVSALPRVPPSLYPPPSSAAAAASTSSSAETPRPLHTLSHHAAGKPLPLIRHFRAQVARSGPGVRGGWELGWGEDTRRELVSQNAYPAQAPSL